MKLPFAMPHAGAFVTSIFFTSGPSNPCDYCVVMRDWTTPLLLGSKRHRDLSRIGQTSFLVLQGNTVGRIEEAPRTEACPVVRASTSLASLGSTLPQEEKLKLADKLLMVSSRII